MRYPALQGKRDANEADIIKALLAVGATVDKNPIGGGKPDLDVGYMGRNFKLEVKTPGGKLNKLQRLWHKAWCGQVIVVYSVPDALRAIGAL